MPSKAIKLDEATYDRLKALGDARKRTPHWLMKEAIRQFLEREEDAERLRHDTLERLERFRETGEAISHDVVEAWLETWGTDREGKCPTS